jgi:putative transcriptional regulator
MPIIVTLDVMLARRKMKGKDLCVRIGISETQLSLLRSGKVRGVRFSTFAKMCAVLECTPGELLDYRFDPADLEQAPSDDN